MPQAKISLAVCELLSYMRQKSVLLTASSFVRRLGASARARGAPPA